tara:strand:+ start:381 stop:836 length:456 start_codon:yes stop_codon:yes gene_type:complete
MLSKEDFLNVINYTPLIAFEILVKCNEKYLVGMRNNEPAKGYYFNPGGRIYKNETIMDACKRITLKELGIELDFNRFKHHMNTQHIYDNNVFNNNYNTHYVCMAYIIEITEDEKNSLKFDNQHNEFIWLKKGELLNHKLVHNNTKNYFLNL